MKQSFYYKCVCPMLAFWYSFWKRILMTYINWYPSSTALCFPHFHRNPCWINIFNNVVIFRKNTNHKICQMKHNIFSWFFYSELRSNSMNFYVSLIPRDKTHKTHIPNRTQTTKLFKTRYRKPSFPSPVIIPGNNP